MASFEFLHRERRHCVLVLLVLVLVFVFVWSSSLPCGAPRRILRTHRQYPVSRLLMPAFSCMCVENDVVCVWIGHGSRVFETTESAQDACDAHVVSLFVF